MRTGNNNTATISGATPGVSGLITSPEVRPSGAAPPSLLAMSETNKTTILLGDCAEQMRSLADNFQLIR